MDELREQAHRIHAELAPAEQEWQEWAIDRRRVGTVLDPDGGSSAETETTPDVRDADAPSAPREAAKPKYASDCPPRPRIQPGIGSNGRMAAHSASVMSVG
ncbi:hypothetical protein M878_43845 [Streptomyces roseochromogenus subsp. oscitans DS 12.976]|uniref:Uncharacterized protein n=1 Tax=Streptomyces roseochromogenus subsp. oscitans DS 12.976 TaxID=1352936 RepID=V6JI88_STRRC|nr:hypothetical protein M878_43845 [Streptomyces roseochromogenus subsp. oscitans DS 12.976]